MRELFLKLTTGLPRKDIPRAHRNLINDLIQLGLVENRPILQLAEGVVVGEVDLTRQGFGFLTPLGPKKGKDLFIAPSDLHGANDGDLVIGKLLPGRRRGRRRVKVIYLLEKRFPVRVVYLQFLKRRGRKIPVLRNIKTGEPLFLKPVKGLKKLPPGTVLKIDSYTNRILEVLGVLEDPAVDEKISLALYNRPDQFSKKAQMEAEAFGDRVEREFYPGRVDLTHLPFVTIDPEGAKDHDDGIYFDRESRTLYVAIADVSEYVYPNGGIDQEAKIRGFSVYFPHRAVPMLPPQLSENLCSLKEGEERLAFIFKISFTPDWQVEREELIEGIIQVRKRYSYPEVDRFLEQLERGEELENLEDREIFQWLFPFHQLAQELRRRRLKGGLTFESDEIRMRLTPDGELEEVWYEPETPSHQLIEEGMLLANRAAAEMIEFGIFRVHDEPSKVAIKELYTTLELLGIEIGKGKRPFPEVVQEIQRQAEELGIRRYVDKLIIKAQQQAQYAPENRGHFALGFSKYTHFTSPIRRYSDLTLHRILKAILRREKRQLEYLLREVGPLTDHLSKVEREVQKVEWDFYDRKFARWAQKRIGESFIGIVEDSDPPPIVRLEDSEIVGARVFVESLKEYPLFQRVRVKITRVDLPAAKIYGEVLEELDLPYHPTSAPGGEREGDGE